MKPNPSTQVVNVGNETENVRLGLDLSAATHLISVLTNLYSDPVAAVIREYSTNAIDSHIEAKNEAPIEVSLPSSSDPFFKVRDFGLGLSINGIRDTYALYGASTKRESDEVNGMLGLGCKSALTYAPSFNIASVHDGVKILATVVKDYDGVGTIKILDTVTCNEPNGVEIAVPIKPYDHTKFIEQAKTFFYNWKKGTVLVNGKQPETIWDDPKVIWLDGDVAVELGPAYGVNHHIVQHNVSYPTTIEGLTPKIKITAFVPIGSVNFTPSREALHNTPRTKETLTTLKKYINENLMRVLTERVEKAPTPWERAKIASSWASLLHQNFKGMNHHIQPPSGFPIFYGRGSGGYGRQAEYTKDQSVSVANIIDETKFLVVVGHNLRTITQLSKLRLKDYRDSHGFKGAVLLPDNCSNVEILSGRSNVVAWEKIKAATEHVKTPRNQGGRDETVYSCRRGTKDMGNLTIKEITALGFPVVYGINTFGSGQFSEVVTVNIATISFSRIKKCFPDAVEVFEYQRIRIKQCSDALTTEDKATLAARNNNFLRKLNGLLPDEVKDPLLNSGIKAFKAKESATIAAYVGVGGNLNSISVPQTYGILESRYQLLQTVGGINNSNRQDVLLYLNAKYESTQP